MEVRTLEQHVRDELGDYRRSAMFNGVEICRKVDADYREIKGLLEAGNLSWRDPHGRPKLQALRLECSACDREDLELVVLVTEMDGYPVYLCAKCLNEARGVLAGHLAERIKEA